MPKISNVNPMRSRPMRQIPNNVIEAGINGTIRDKGLQYQHMWDHWQAMERHHIHDEAIVQRHLDQLLSITPPDMGWRVEVRPASFREPVNIGTDDPRADIRLSAKTNIYGERRPIWQAHARYRSRTSWWLRTDTLSLAWMEIYHKTYRKTYWQAVIPFPYQPEDPLVVERTGMVYRDTIQRDIVREGQNFYQSIRRLLANAWDLHVVAEAIQPMWLDTPTRFHRLKPTVNDDHTLTWHWTLQDETGEHELPIPTGDDNAQEQSTQSEGAGE